MGLSAAQLVSLKTDIAANVNTIPAGQPWTGSFAGQAINTLPNNGDGNAAITGWYNLLAATAWWVWRTAVSESEFVSTTGVDVANADAATTWSWTAYIARSQGERDAWARLFSTSGGFANPALANVRQGVADIFSGSANNAPAQRNHLLVLSKRKATNAEKLFSTGIGSFASPAVMTVEGNIATSDVEAARSLT